MALAVKTKLHHWLKQGTWELLKIETPKAHFCDTSAAIDVTYKLKLNTG
jgi:hypothetical protein